MITRVWNKVRRVTAGVLGMRELRRQGIEPGSGLVLHGIPVVSVSPGSEIRIGSRVVLCSDSKYTALGVNHPVVLRTLAPGATLIIGDDVGISGGSICVAQRVTIGASTMLGANVTIADTDFHSLAPANRRYNKDPQSIQTAEVVIEENVFIGTNSIILKGVRIGRNSVIGAGSVVTKDVPANVVAAGNPCRVLRSLGPDTVTEGSVPL